jgi:hypothetical protein
MTKLLEIWRIYRFEVEEKLPTLTERDLFTSEFASVLHGRKLHLIDRPDRGSPLPAWARLHAKLARTFRYALDAIDALIAKREEEHWGHHLTGLHQEATDAIEDVIYSAAEIFSFYEGDIPYYFDISKNIYNRSIKSEYDRNIKEQKRFCAMLCNACKHNHHFLVPIEVTYQNLTRSLGFTVYSRSGNIVAVSKSIIPDSGAFSFRRTLNNVLARVILADHFAANLVRSLPDELDADPIDCAFYKLPYLHTVMRLKKLSDVEMPGEQPSFEFDHLENEEIRINRDFDPEKYKGEYGPASLSMFMDLLGRELHFEFPYTGKDFHATLTTPDGDPSPMAGEMRLDIRDHPLPSTRAAGSQDPAAPGAI